MLSVPCWYFADPVRSSPLGRNRSEMGKVLGIGPVYLRCRRCRARSRVAIAVRRALPALFLHECWNCWPITDDCQSGAWGLCAQRKVLWPRHRAWGPGSSSQLKKMLSSAC